MSRNTYSTPKLYIGDVEYIDYSSITYKNTGSNKISTLNIKLSDPDRDGASLIGQEVVFFLNYGSVDTVPFFRGYVKSFTPSDKGLSLNVHDVLAFLSGFESPPLIITDENNYDGYTLSQMLHEYITTRINKNKVLIGLDMLNETTPPVSLSGYRKKSIHPIKIIQEKTPKDVSVLADVVTYRVVLRDDGNKSNITFVREQDIDSAGITFSFLDGIEKIKYKRRPAPNYFSAEVDGRVMEYQHNTLPSGINMGKLDGEFAYPDAAKQEAFFVASQEEHKKEITITTNKGHYLDIGNVVNLYLPDYPSIKGKHRIIGKNISYSKSGLKCSLKLSKEEPRISDYLVTLEN